MTHSSILQSLGNRSITRIITFIFIHLFDRIEFLARPSLRSAPDLCSLSLVSRPSSSLLLLWTLANLPFSLALCVLPSLTPQPTPQEREQGIGSKWARKGLWWFRFEIKSTLPDERTGKIVTLATKDASDHTFAVKTANWGWQQFSKRDQLFLNSSALASDSFVIICTIQAQPQPPAGYWLGMGLPPNSNWLGATTSVGNRPVGSGGGLSAWSGGEGASGGVAGGTTAAGGVKRVVPRELVSAVGSLLDDERECDHSKPMSSRHEDPLLWRRRASGVMLTSPQSTLTSSSSSPRRGRGGTVSKAAENVSHLGESTPTRSCCAAAPTSRPCSPAASARSRVLSRM